jgi:hypothetical protein
MAWAKISRNGYLIATESLTLPTGASTASNTSAIDFIPRGRGFVTLVNTGATDLASAASVDLQSRVGAGGVYSEHVSGAIAAIDAAIGVYKFRPRRDDAALATAPDYRLQLVHGGNQTGENVDICVIIDLSDSDSLSK